MADGFANFTHLFLDKNNLNPREKKEKKKKDIVMFENTLRGK